MRKSWLCGLIFFYGWVHAGGFQVNTQGQKAIGMGGSLTGRALDASVVFFNPAGMSMLDSSYINAGGAFLLSRTSFLGQDGRENLSLVKPGIPLYLFAAWQKSPKWAFGLSINSPFSLRKEWEKEWSGRFITLDAQWSTIHIQPSVSYRISNSISIGGGPVIGFSGIRSRNALPVSNVNGTDAEMEIEGSGLAYGFNAGIYLDLGRTSAGLSYRSAMAYSIDEGTATFENMPSSLIENSIYPSSAGFTTDFTLPSVISLGIGHTLTEKLMAHFEFNYTSWSALDELNYEFQDNADLNRRDELSLENSAAFRIGLAYQYSERLGLRAGIGLDQRAVPDNKINPMLPDANRSIITTGFTWRMRRGFSFEGSFMFESLRERNENNNQNYNFNGSYKTFNYVAGLGLQYQF
jgi:long-chain fatty acid transport protein